MIGLLSYFVPCLVFGQNAEKLGESCVMYGLSQLVPLLGLYCRVSVRGRIREQKGIEGSCFKDLLCVLCLPMCALAQEAQVNLLTYVQSCQLFIILYSLFHRNLDLEANPWQENEPTRHEALFYYFCKHSFLFLRYWT